jgi:hypothetical protein
MPPPKFPKPKPKPQPGRRRWPWGRPWRRGLGPEIIYVEGDAGPWLDEWWYFDAWDASPRRLAAEGPVVLHSNFDALRRSQAMRTRFPSAAFNRAFRWDTWRGAWVQEPSWQG